MTKDKHSRSLTAIAVILVALCSLPMVRAAVKGDDSRKAKSQYIVNNALKQSSKDNPGIYMRMLEAAAQCDSSDGYLQLLRGQMSGSREEAMRRMSPYAEKHPDDQYVAMPYIVLLAQSGEVEKAYRLVDRLTDAMPENMSLREFELMLCANTDSLMRGMRAIDAMEKLGIDAPTAMGYRLELFGSTETLDTLGLISYLEKNVEVNPTDTVFLPTLINVYNLVGRSEKASEMADEYLKNHPENYSAYMLSADIAVSNDDLGKARDILMRCIRTHRFDPSPLLQGILETKQDTLYPLVDSIAAAYPDDEYLREGYLLFKYTSGNAEAVDSLLSISDKPMKLTSPYGAYAAISAKLSLDKPQDALAIYKQAKADGVTSGEVDDMLPYIYVLMQDTACFTALRDSLLADYLPGIKDLDSLPVLPYSELYGDAGKAAQLYTMESELYHKTGDKEKCLRSSRNALTINPDDAEVLNNYAYFVSESTDDPAMLSEALTMVSRALNISPDLNKFDTLAWILFKQKDYGKALGIMEAVVEALDTDSGNNADIIAHLGDIYAATGNIDKALEYWNKSLSLNPEDVKTKQKIAERKYIE